MKISALLERLEEWVPLELAESWDASGLQVGDPDRAVKAVYLCLDVDLHTLDEAEKRGANLILSHHPLLFSPLKRVDVRTKTGQLIQVCLTRDLTVYSLHTNLDKAAGGMNDYVAARLGIRELSVLVPSKESRVDGYKLVTFVPSTHRDVVLSALFEAGGGVIGSYEGCSFLIPGEGTFYAGEATHPFVGERGTLNRVDEVRIEVRFSSDTIHKGIAALMRVHPYEVPAFDIYSLHSVSMGAGFGRVGRYVPPLPWEAFLGRLREVLGIRGFRWIGEPVDPVSRVAVCTGSGAPFIPEAARHAQVYLTGDVKFHEAQEAISLGLTVVDAGHFALERVFADLMEDWFQKSGFIHRSKIIKSSVERDPFRLFHEGETL